MKNNGGGCGKFLSFLLGVVVGIVLIVGSVVGFGFWAYNNVTLSKLEKTFNVTVPIVGDELKSKTIKELIPEAMTLMNAPVGDIAETLGYTIPTTFEVVPASGSSPAVVLDFSEAIGLVLDGKINEVQANLNSMINTFTIGYIYSVIEEPLDMPKLNLFTKYQNVKITQIGNIINQITVEDVMEPQYDEDNELIEYTGIIAALADETLVSLMSGDMQDLINGLQLKDVITISATDTGVLGALKDLSISELNNTNILNAISSKKISDILNITATTGVMAKLKDVTIGQISSGDIDDEISELKLSEIMDITDTSGVMFTLKDKTIGELNQSTIMALKVKDIYNITETSGMMFAIKDWSLSELTETKIKTLKINQIINIPTGATGVLASIKDWTINDLTESNIQNLTLGNVLNITETTGILGTISNWKLNELTEDNLKTLTLAQALNITSEDGIIGALKDLRLSELDDAHIQSSIQTLTVEEVIDLEESDNLIWQAIKTSTIGGLTTTLNGLTLSQLVAPNGTGTDEGEYVGILSYLITETNDPLITDLDTAIDDAVEAYMQDITIGELIDENIINQPTGYTATELEELRAKKLTEFLNEALIKS